MLDAGCPRTWRTCPVLQMVNRAYFTLISVSLVAAASRHAYDKLGHFSPRHLRLGGIKHSSAWNAPGSHMVYLGPSKACNFEPTSSPWHSCCLIVIVCVHHLSLCALYLPRGSQCCPQFARGTFSDYVNNTCKVVSQANSEQGDVQADTPKGCLPCLRCPWLCCQQVGAGGLPRHAAVPPGIHLQPAGHTLG